MAEFMPESLRVSGQDYYDNSELDRITPIHAVNFDDETEVMGWTKAAYNYLIEHQVEPKAVRCLENINLVKGIQNYTQDDDGQYIDRHGRRISSATRKMHINELLSFVNQRVARLSRFPVAVTAVPYSNEHSDKEGAEVTKKVLDTLDYRLKLGDLKRRADRKNTIEGEAVAFVFWDKNAGDIDERWIKAKEKLGDKSGKVEVQGKTFKYDPKKPLRIGDAQVRMLHNWEIGFEPGKEHPQDIEWIMKWSYEPVESLKKDYPESAEKILATPEAYRFDAASMYSEKLAGHVLKIEVFAKSTQYLDGGKHWIMTPEIMLEKPEDNPYPRQDDQVFGNLPIVRVTDIDIDGEFNGFPTVSVLAPHQHTLNQMLSMTKQAILMAGHPKIGAPRQGKINVTALGNDTTLVEYNAPYKPEVINSGTLLPTEIFSFIDLVTRKINQLGGQQEISKGELPSNVRSGRQIRLLEELEGLSAVDVVKKSEQFMLDIYKKLLAVVGKYYKEDEQRLINIMGDDKRYMIDSFDVSVLSKPYDIRVLPSSNLPQTPAARIAAVAELFAIPDFKQLYTNEQWADMLDLGTPEKFHEGMKSPVSKAEWENERFIQGKVPPLPTDGDNHLVHWKVHSVIFESKSYLDFSESIREAAETHMMAHEMEMLDHAGENPAFGQQLLQMPGFPKFFKQLPSPTGPNPEPPAPQGQSGQPQAQKGVAQMGSGSLVTDGKQDQQPEGLLS